VYDALINKRPYKEAWDRIEALEEMVKMNGKKFDPKIMDVFLNFFLNMGLILCHMFLITFSKKGMK